MFTPLKDQLDRHLNAPPSLSPERRGILESIAAYTSQRLQSGETAHLQFICTHNSRRSQFAQWTAALWADYFELDHIRTYSGGTEVTALNPRAAAALGRLGFEVMAQPDEQPSYHIRWSEEMPAQVAFSKVYEHSDNPSRDFAAVMVCSAADANCPVVLGADQRFSLTFEDPKVADGRPDEAQVYDERLHQIMGELGVAFQQIHAHS